MSENENENDILVILACPAPRQSYRGWKTQILRVIRRIWDVDERIVYKEEVRLIADRSSRAASFILFAWRVLIEIVYTRKRKRLIVLPIYYFESTIIHVMSLMLRVPVLVRLSGGELRRRNRVSFALRKAMIKRAGCVVALNHEQRLSLLQSGVAARNIRTIPNSFDPQFRPPMAEERKDARHAIGLGADVLVVGSVGTVCRRKGQLHIIEALGALGLNAVLVLCGPTRGHNEADRGYAEQCFELARTIGVEVVHIEHSSDVRRVLWALDVFAFPSSYEGSPNALVEAMASGLPCVGFDIAGVNEVIVHGVSGILVKAGSSTEFAGALEGLLVNPSARLDMGQNARMRVASAFNSDQLDAQYRDAIASVLSKPHDN